MSFPLAQTAPGAGVEAEQSRQPLTHWQCWAWCTPGHTAGSHSPCHQPEPKDPFPWGCSARLSFPHTVQVSRVAPSPGAERIWHLPLTTCDCSVLPFIKVSLQGLPTPPKEINSSSQRRIVCKLTYYVFWSFINTLEWAGPNALFFSSFNKQQGTGLILFPTVSSFKQSLLLN